MKLNRSIYHPKGAFNLRVRIIIICFFSLLCTTISCSQQTGESATLFDLLPAEETGIEFINSLEEKPGNNILESEFFYNGGGVAVGDINNDGLPDIYFTANKGSNGLFLNEGNFSFTDITVEAGVTDSNGWSAGTAMADINGDGYLDIYVCKAGDLPDNERNNLLYINNGDETFTERAAEFGLDDAGYCTQPVFFDSNGNGLLDLFIVNYNTRSFTNFDIQTIRDETDPFAGDKLYRNNGDGTFTDVSAEAGILQNPIGFGLSATVSDLNSDGHPDIYVTNDFMERDYMYINQGDGTFRDEILNRTYNTSYFSMGSDIADINNSGYPDITVVDMLPPDYRRRSVFKHPDPNIYDHLAANGYHRKNMRNTLQVNNGDGTFSEMGQLAGISMTDWSWSVLAADFDNSGHNDLHITNGFPRFYTDLDYLNQVLWDMYPDEDLPDDPELKYDLVRQMKTVEMTNRAFRNEGSLSFSEVTNEWGLERMSVSGGAAYSDLNNDGSLDLVVNNINEPAFIYRNNSRELNRNNWMKIELKGTGSNRFGVGATVLLTADKGRQYMRESYPVRGFQSSVDPVLHIGLGDAERADVEVTWPDGSRNTYENIEANQVLVANQEDASATDRIEENETTDTLFTELDPSALGINFKHEGASAGDLIMTPLLPYTLSNRGPALAQADINNDGLQDIYIGGGPDQAGTLYLQNGDGMFQQIPAPALEEDAAFDDTDAIFFDANGNGHADLYVVSGGNSDRMNGKQYQDRLYLNDGFGNFSGSGDNLPQMHTSGGSVTVLDFNDDGYRDLFVAGYTFTGRYPVPPSSYLLENRNGSFVDVTQEKAPGLMNPGMVTDSHWADITGNGQNELIIAGEWMPIKIFEKTESEGFREITEESGLTETSGWWNAISVVDIDNDGNLDIIGGNWGKNSSYRASAEDPIIVYVDDFMENAFYDPIITQVFDGERYPVAGRDQLLKQLPELRETFPDYRSFSSATIHDLFSEKKLREADTYSVQMLESSIFLNLGDGTFDIHPLPNEAQSAPVFDTFVDDFYQNGISDILLTGNNFGLQPSEGPIATEGNMLKAATPVQFESVLPVHSGLFASGDIRSVELVPTQIGPLFLFAGHNQSIIPYLYTYSPDED
ncbi:MAG: VCBS repeat-containing protein [Bacteroidota bacterium]